MMKVFQSCLASLLLVSGFVQAATLASPMAASQQEQLQQGLEFIQNKKFQQAEEHFQKLSQQFPQQIIFLNNMAVAQMSQGKTEEALQNLKSAMVADKHYSITQQNMNLIYAYMASKAYSVALDKKFNPTLPELVSITDVKPVIENVPEDVQEPEAQLPEIKSPEKESESVASTDPDLLQTLKDKTDAWVASWVKGDVTSYIASYSSNFKPAGQLSYQDWKAQRRYRLRNSKLVEVSYNQLNMYLNADKNTAIVEFVQHYKAGTYQDKVRKQLYWTLEGENWLISREQVTENFK